MPNVAQHEDVERRAYELYEQRGREDGHDWDDWLQAEREMRGAEPQRNATEAADASPRRRRVERATELAPPR
jgi:Protein of unknown function (DUF2934)